MSKPIYTCHWCNAQFSTHNRAPKFCCLDCKNESQQFPVDVDRIAALYAAGATQDEIAAALGCSQKVIFGAMRRNKIETRVAAKRNQWGANNDSWKADEATYAAFHYRMRAKFGSPMKCDECGTTDPERAYDWANLTGHYEDTSDYKRMCRSCHWRFDEKHKNFQGSVSRNA